MATLSLTATVDTVSFTLSALDSNYVYSASAEIYEVDTSTLVGSLLFPNSDVGGATSISGTFTGLDSLVTYRVWTRVYDSTGATTSLQNAEIETDGYGLLVKTYQEARDGTVSQVGSATYTVAAGESVALSTKIDRSGLDAAAQFDHYTIKSGGHTTTSTTEQTSFTVLAHTVVEAYFVVSGPIAWIYTGSGITNGWTPATPSIYTSNGWS